jgi:hypothetical protein
MTTKKISELTHTEDLSNTNNFVVVQDGETKKTSLEVLSNNIVQTAKNEINQMGFVKSDTQNLTQASAINNIVAISQEEFDSMQEKDPNTLYIVKP